MDPYSAQSSPTLRDPISFAISSPSPKQSFDIQAALEKKMASSDGSDSSQTAPVDAQSPTDEGFFDLQPPAPKANRVKVEDARLLSAEHLNFILGDQSLFQKFTTFLNRFHAHMVPTLIRYLEMRKAVKAIEFANAIARQIRWPSHTDYCKFSRVQAGAVDVRFEDYAARELLLLCTEALPAFVTHALLEVVSDCVAKDIMGQAIPVVKDLVGNLAEVFCLTDPSVHDNPIIFASEEFHRTTQYGTSYAINRNCRFLQGPGTDQNTVLRLSQAITLGRECNEVLLNYRRDGTPFINLLMSAPLYDDRGRLKYFIGAQIDVTGLIEHGMGIEYFRALLQKEQESEERNCTPRYEDTQQSKNAKETLDRLQELSMMFSQEEAEVVKGNSRCDDDIDACSIRSVVPTSNRTRGPARRIIGAEELPGDGLNLSKLNFLNNPDAGNTLPGAYQHYLLVRPDPSLQIIFVSPSLRLPGILRTHLFSKLGGPAQTINALQDAFRDGASVTAKVLWLPKNERGRSAAEKPRWIRCTPLLGSDDRVGVWMIILIPVETQVRPFGRMEHVGEIVDEVEIQRKRLNAISMAGSRAGSVVPHSRTASREGFVRPAPRDTMTRPPTRDGLIRPPTRTGSVEPIVRRLEPLDMNPIGSGTLGRMRRGRPDDGLELYAEYLRSSSPATSTFFN
ncbi:hypothetical protein HYALB_00003797 [Hymenoscyphus albidus]|uniref:PAC domain-containing protein n=1 Tax=Hymenoscyphus albidus TaxID=595503 RepID=A0A9N9PZZ4_9HELO|nr:hypothetical protein HYALB_00003797 [Hymenoscyphus albidus]